MKFFDIDSPFAKYMTFLYDAILLNIYFVAISFFSMGLGIGVGFTAMIYAIYHGFRRGESNVSKLFFKSVKQNFKNVTVYWLFAILIFWGASLTLAGIDKDSPWGTAAIASQYVLIYEIFIISIYYFAIQSKLEMKNLEAIKSAVILSNRHVRTTLFIVLMALFSAFSGYFLAFYLLLIGFFLLAYTVERVILEKVLIGKYVNENVRAALKIDKESE